MFLAIFSAELGFSGIKIANCGSLARSLLFFGAGRIVCAGLER